jgi:hypothetical protein
MILTQARFERVQEARRSLSYFLQKVKDRIWRTGFRAMATKDQTISQ